MEDKFFFEIPIYRCSYDQYSKDQKELLMKIEDYCSHNKKYGVKIFNDVVKTIYYSQSYCYDYNEVMAWIQLYIVGYQVRGDLFYEGHKGHKGIKKAYRKGIRPKKFYFEEKFFEISISYKLSNKEIFERILDTLDISIKTNFKNRYADLEKFKNIGKYVNWKRLIKELNSYNQV
jgi:hypothetical protein